MTNTFHNTQLKTGSKGRTRPWLPIALILMFLSIVSATENIYDVLPVFTERTFDDTWEGPSTCKQDGYGGGGSQLTEDPFYQLTLEFHCWMGEGACLFNDNYRGTDGVVVPEGRRAIKYSAVDGDNFLGGYTYKNKGKLKPGTQSGYWEYICDYSQIYSDGGKFFFRYHLTEGANYEFTVRESQFIVTGTGKWEWRVVENINALNKGAGIFAFQPEPAHLPKNYEATLYVDDAFFYKGTLSDGFKNGTVSTKPVAAHKVSASPIASVSSNGLLVLKNSQPSQVRLFNTSGKLLYSAHATGKINLADGANLSRGYYLIEVQAGSISQTLPLVMSGQ